VGQWFQREFGVALATCSVIAYMQEDPLGFISIMLDIAGEHETAAQLDAINAGLLEGGA
jgi:hypothetical protein